LEGAGYATRGLCRSDGRTLIQICLIWDREIKELLLPERDSKIKGQGRGLLPELVETLSPGRLLSCYLSTPNAVAWMVVEALPERP
jgi:hypothetical protein